MSQDDSWCVSQGVYRGVSQGISWGACFSVLEMCLRAYENVSLEGCLWVHFGIVTTPVSFFQTILHQTVGAVSSSIWRDLQVSHRFVCVSVAHWNESERGACMDGNVFECNCDVN